MDSRRERDTASPRTVKSSTRALDSQAKGTRAPANSQTLLMQQAASHPAMAGPAGLLALQRTYGNQAVQRLILSAPGSHAPTTIQAKLTVGAAHDEYEQEADQVAQKVVSGPAPAAAQQPPAPGQKAEDEDVQRKPLAASITPLVQRAAPAPRGASRFDSFDAGPDFERGLSETRGGGSPLPAQARAYMEPRFGADFSNVRVHTGGAAAQLNRKVSAQAFTKGRDIYLGQGAADFSSRQGKELLAHELTHVVQQSGTQSVQRRIGFELETGIPVMKTIAPDKYRGMNNDELESPVAGGKLMVDHLPGHPQTTAENFDEWNVVEFVTNPVADNLSNSAFRNLVTPWIQNLQGIRNYAQTHFTNFRNAPGVGAANPYIYIGLRPGIHPGYNKWNRIAPQATMGVKLKNVGKAFSGATAGGYEGHVRHDRVSEGLHKAGPAADRVMTQLKTLYPAKVGGNKGKNSLKGLLTLMCNYLLVGDALRGKGGYLKNMSTFMYKSKLSNVATQIDSEYYAHKILKDPARRDQARDLLMQETNRTANEDVIEGAEYPQGTPVDVQPWIDEVLSGTEDKVFLSAKNPWSNEISPEDIGGKKGAVMELRDISAYNINGLGLTMDDDAGIVDYLAQVYALNKEWKK